MASLNTLRTRGGVIVSVVIGLALLSFVLGDIFSSGGSLFNSRKMKMGEINGVTIGYNEYDEEAARYQVISESLSGRDNLSSEETDAVRDMAWESLVMKYAFRPGFSKLGLFPTENEQTDMVGGIYMSPVIASSFTDPATGVFDVASLNGLVSQAEVDSRAALVWQYFKEQMNDQRTMSKYIDLVSKGLFVNDLEVEASIALNNTAYGAKVLSMPYSEIADSTISISSSEIKKYYKNNKFRFRQTPSRDIEYVVFDVYPSQADYDEAQKYIDEIAQEFAGSDNPMQYASLNSYVTPSTRYLKDTEIDGAIAAAVFNNPGEMYGPVLTGDTYVLARQSDFAVLPDSLRASFILLPSGSDRLADSIVRVARTGSDFEMLALNHSEDQTVQENGGDIGYFAPEMMADNYREAFLGANTGDVFKMDDPDGIRVFKLTYKSRPVEKAQIATIRYKVEPSSATQMAAYSEASEFMAKAVSSYENFNKAANELSVSKRTVRIRNTDREISGMNNSRELIRWAFNNKQGSVSDIKEIDGHYVVAALTDVRDGSYATVEQAASAIRSTLRNEKKAEMLAKELAGSSINEISTHTGRDITEVSGVQFAPVYLDGIGVEPKLIGAIFSDKYSVGSLSQPVDGYMGVYVFEVTGKETLGEIDERGERVRLEAMATSYLAERLTQALSEKSDITDMRVKFY